MITTNTQILVNRFVKVFSHAVVLLLLCSMAFANATINITDLEIAFAKVSGKVGDSEKIAGCLVAWWAKKPNSKHVYCRYELEKDANFLRDDDEGISPSQLKTENKNLPTSENKSQFTLKIKNWFKNQYSLNLFDDYARLIADAMSSLEDSSFSLFLGKLSISPFPLANQAKNNTEFAVEVHKLIKEKKITDFKPVSFQLKKLAEKVANRAYLVNNRIAELEKTMVAEDTLSAFLNSREFAIALSTVNIILIFGILFLGFFLNEKLRVRVFDTKKIPNLLKQQTKHQEQLKNLNEELENLKKIRSQVEALQNFRKEIKEVERKIDSVQQEISILSKPVKEELDSQKEAFSQRIQELENSLKNTEDQLRSEQEQHKNAENALTEANEKIKTLSLQYEVEKETREKAESDLNNLKKEHETLQSDNQTFSQLYDAEKEKHQNVLAKYKKAEATLQAERKKAETDLQAEREKAETALKTALKKAQDERATLAQQYEQDLQNIFKQRLRIIPPENRDFSEWTRDFLNQRAVWSWAQITLAGEFLACETQINQIQTQDNERSQPILDVLEVDSWLEHSKTIVGQLFESNAQLWQGLNNEGWLKQLLRADDLLQAYFLDEKSFMVLAKHLSSISGILQAMFAEMDIVLIRPKLLEIVPDYVSVQRPKPKPTLKVLVKPKINIEALNKKKGGMVVVDIEKYGFKTTDNQNPEVRVYVSSPAEWEQ